jgi:hypothetical protein
MSEKNGHAEARDLFNGEAVRELLSKIDGYAGAKNDAERARNTEALLGDRQTVAGLAELSREDAGAYEQVMNHAQAARLRVQSLRRAVKGHNEREAREARKAQQTPGTPGTPGFYGVGGGRHCRIIRDPQGNPCDVPLCNFLAEIVREESIDDGSGELRHVFVIEGRRQDGRVLPPATVTHQDYDRMAWPTAAWGTDAVVYAGQGTRDHLRVAVLDNSRRVEKHRVYKHTGWREVGGRWLYLHGNGAVGPDGTDHSLHVELDGALSRFALPDPPEGEDLGSALRAELRFLELSRPALTFPLLATAYRAALGPADFSVSLIGKTGYGKTELAAQVQQHFGPEMNRLALPANWSSTANALEGLAFLAKDAVLVIDEFKAGGGRYEADQLHAKADRVLRAQGNWSGRQRCHADGTLRGERCPRGIILITGEDTVRGESLRARNLPLLVRPGDVDVRKLTPYQKDAASGLYAQAVAGFLRHLAPQYEKARGRLRKEYARLREKAWRSEGHPRTAGVVADLAAGLGFFLDFAAASGVITPDGRKQLAAQGWKALLEASADQASEVQEQRPTARFLELVGAVITMGQGHLANGGGEAPEDPGAWGWREEEFPTGGGNTGTRWVARGHLVGWLDDGCVYLDPHAAFAEAQRLADQQKDSLTLSKQQLWRQLKEEKLLTLTEKDRIVSTRRLQGRDRSVLFIGPRGYPPLGIPGVSGDSGG